MQTQPVIAPSRADPADTDDWPIVWAKCWSRIRSWRVPPRWTFADWRDEAKAQGALAAREALRDFDPERGVPKAAYLYQKIIAAAWTRYRQEWTFGRRVQDLAPVHDQAESDSLHLDPEQINRLAAALDRLPDADRLLIVQLFWHGGSEAVLSLALGISQQGVNKRKQRILQRLRSFFETAEFASSEASCEIG